MTSPAVNVARSRAKTALHSAITQLASAQSDEDWTRVERLAKEALHQVGIARRNVSKETK